MAGLASRRHRRVNDLEREAAAWLGSRLAPTDTSALYNTLLALPFITKMSQRNMPAYITQSELALRTTFCTESGGLPLRFPRSRSKCACANLSDIHVDNIDLSGSIRELSNVYIFPDEASDIDVMFRLGNVGVMMPGAQAGLGTEDQQAGATRSCGNFRHGLQVTQERTARPGYVLLRHRLLESCQHVSPLSLDASSVVQLMDAFRRQVTVRPSYQSGPSLTSTFNRIQGQEEWTSIDLVACILCPVWRHEDFASRWRSSGFPSPRLVEKLCRTPAFLVPVGFRGSETEAQEWRLSFSRHEYIVYRSMSEQQRLCLTVLKHCRAVIGKDAKPLKSFYMKTALLWLAERRPADQWTPGTMHESLILILHYLRVCLLRGYLPCYFWPEVNLLAGKSDAELAEVSAAVAELRCRLLPAVLALMADWLGQSAASLAQTLLADCRMVSSIQLDKMALVKNLGDLMQGKHSAILRLLEPLANGSPFSGQTSAIPFSPSSCSFLYISALTKGAKLGSPGAVSHIIDTTFEVVKRVSQQQLDSVEDRWMPEY